MNIRAMPTPVLLLTAVILAACDRGEVDRQPLRKVTYADDVAPILQKHCTECHVAGAQGAEATGLLLDSYASLMKGDQYGPVIDPGSARTSSLYILITGKDHLTVNMPHGKAPLSAEDIETIRLWIDNGVLE
jgi:hypothetical protein